MGGESGEVIMYVENYIIVGVVDNLNPEINYFKDYIFPIVSAFFASILGAITAYFTLRHQDIIKIEKEKLDTINKWTLIAQQVQADLFALKSNMEKRSAEPGFCDPREFFKHQ